MKKRLSRASIIILMLAAVITVYAILFIVYNTTTGTVSSSKIGGIIGVCIICVAIDAVLIVSALGLWVKLLRRVARKVSDPPISEAEIDAAEAQCSDAVNEFQDKENGQAEKKLSKEEKIKRFIEKRESRPPFCISELIGCIVAFLIACGISAFMFWHRHNELTKYENDPNYVTTVAVAQYVRIDGRDSYSLEYVFYGEDGERYILSNVGRFDGVSPRVGSELNVYYPIGRPEAALAVEDARMFLVGAVIFLSLGVIFLVWGIFQNNSAACIAAFGTVFAAAGCSFVFGAGMFFHVGFIGAIMIGASAYGMMCMAICGAALALYGYYGLVRNAYYTVLARKYKKANSKRY